MAAIDTSMRSCGREGGEKEAFAWAVQLTGERRWQIGGRGRGCGISVRCCAAATSAAATTADAAATAAGHLSNALELERGLGGGVRQLNATTRLVRCLGFRGSAKLAGL